MKRLPGEFSQDGTSLKIVGKRHAIFLVEDHPITQAGLTSLVDREPDLYVCGHADNASAGVEMIAKLRPSIVITDIALKTSNGIKQPGQVEFDLGA